MSAITLYTIGHSNRSLEEFLDLLDETGINSLIDARAYPYSKRYPHFNEDSLRQAMEQSGKIYHWVGRQLGGNRQVAEGSPHIALKDEGLQAYADYMGTDDFQVAVMQLINMASHERIAVMCAERSPENCHRSLIADYLVLQGVCVMHLISEVEAKEHYLSGFARRESSELIYDRS